MFHANQTLLQDVTSIKPCYLNQSAGPRFPHGWKVWLANPLSAEPGGSSCGLYLQIATRAKRFHPRTLDEIQRLVFMKKKFYVLKEHTSHSKHRIKSFYKKSLFCVESNICVLCYIVRVATCTVSCHPHFDFLTQVFMAKSMRTPKLYISAFFAKLLPHCWTHTVHFCMLQCEDFVSLELNGPKQVWQHDNDTRCKFHGLPRLEWKVLTSTPLPYQTSCPSSFNPTSLHKLTNTQGYTTVWPYNIPLIAVFEVQVHNQRKVSKRLHMITFIYYSLNILLMNWL